MQSLSESALSVNVKGRLEEIRQQGLFRKASVLSARDINEIEVAGKRLINFSSNDYLGLSRHPKIFQAIKAGFDEFGFGSSASPLICGKTRVHQQLEDELARRTGRDRALLFPSGYQANLGLITALSELQDLEFYIDRLSHASIIDGVLLSGRRFRRYPHVDEKALGRLIGGSASDKKLVLTESVFSMDGDICPIPAMISSCRAHGAKLIVDDAHGFGILGANGNGALEHFGVTQDEVPIMVGTFGKAVGLQGAFVAGDQDLIELIVQKARPYIYSTAFPAPVAAGILASLDVIADEPERRRRLFELIDYFQQRLIESGFDALSNKTPIQPVIIGSSEMTLRICESLREKGVFVVAIRPPTVPNNSARLRISLNAEHTTMQVDLLVEALMCSLKEVKNERQ